MHRNRSSNQSAPYPLQRRAIHKAEAVPDPVAGTVPPGLDVARLFNTERSVLYRIARRHLREPEDAADLVQEAFVRLVQACPPASLRTPAAYLQRIVQNLLRDRFKRAESHMIFCDVTAFDTQASALPPDQGSAIDANDLMAGYADAIAALSPKTRAVFLLHRVDELRYRDIAVQLGITVATVEYHMARALVHLDQALNR